VVGIDITEPDTRADGRSGDEMKGTMESTQRERMREEVAAGLASSPRELSPKYFYDRTGSELFEKITRLPEYYPTRAERALLEEFVPEWIRTTAPNALVELGAGAAEKTRILLDAMRRWSPGATYVPIDISAEFLKDAAAGLREDYPALRIRPVAADISTRLQVPGGLPRPAVFALLGGTIGNFRPAAAGRLLRQVRDAMEDGDRFLLGADLEKAVDVLEAAYNDRAGVTAAFNLNVLAVLNRELGADFDLDAFRHHAFYDQARHRIEMHLVARRPVRVTIPGAGTFSFEEGESIRTEISCKYDRDRVTAMLDEAGMALEHWITGPEGFAISVARPA
jgi:L-histidine N-alpha-methyltransferase